MKTYSASEYAIVLKAFSSALKREAHVLTRQPDLLWQQMYNRLQWEGDYPIEGWVEMIITTP